MSWTSFSQLAFESRCNDLGFALESLVERALTHALPFLEIKWTGLATYTGQASRTHHDLEIRIRDQCSSTLARIECKNLAAYPASRYDNLKRSDADLVIIASPFSPEINAQYVRSLGKTLIQIPEQLQPGDKDAPARFAEQLEQVKNYIFETAKRFASRCPPLKRALERRGILTQSRPGKALAFKTVKVLTSGVGRANGTDNADATDACADGNAGCSNDAGCRSNRGSIAGSPLPCFTDVKWLKPQSASVEKRAMCVHGEGVRARSLHQSEQFLFKWFNGC